MHELEEHLHKIGKHLHPYAQDTWFIQSVENAYYPCGPFQGRTSSINNEFLLSLPSFLTQGPQVRNQWFNLPSNQKTPFGVSVQLITVLPSLELLSHHPHEPRGGRWLVSFIPRGLS